MTVFPVNQLTDFGVDLAELCVVLCSEVQMTAMDITFDQLLAKGITPKNYLMSTWNIPLKFEECRLGYPILLQ